MQLEKIAVRLRRRTSWEALDLGHAMLRAWAGPAYRAWLGSYGLIGLILLCALWSYPSAAVFILWWLKPAFDRILLFVFSRSLFHTPTTWHDILAALPQLIRHSGLLHGLTIGRINMARSFLLPVRQLEQQSGKAARARCKVLSRRGRGNAVWLTFVCANLSAVWVYSLVLLVDTMTPMGLPPIFSWSNWFMGEPEGELLLLFNLFVLLAESLIEPFYVASGFALYLHRRSELEGWDIELAFRRLAARSETPARSTAPTKTAATVIGAIALSACFTFAPDPVLAADPPSDPTAAPEASPARKAIDTVLADPVFGKKSEEKKWRWRPDAAKEKTREDSRWARWLLSMVETASQVLKGLVWVVALALAVWLLYLVVRYYDRWQKGRQATPQVPETLFGLDVRPGSLPDDIAGAARAALAAGRFEAALSLLYRGALVALIHRLRIEFRPGDTETDCRKRVAGQLEKAAGDYFAALLDAWRATAYARQPPEHAAIEALCLGWETHFGTRPEEKTT